MHLRPHHYHPYARHRHGGDLADYIPSASTLYSYGKQAVEGYHDVASTVQPYVSLAGTFTNDPGLKLAGQVLSLSHAHKTKPVKPARSNIDRISRNNADIAVSKKDYGLPIHPGNMRSTIEGLTQPVNSMYYRSGGVNPRNLRAARQPRLPRRPQLNESGQSSSGYFPRKRSNKPRSKKPRKSAIRKRPKPRR